MHLLLLVRRRRQIGAHHFSTLPSVQRVADLRHYAPHLENEVGLVIVRKFGEPLTAGKYLMYSKPDREDVLRT